MPTLLRQSRYRPLLPFVPPSALSPGTDESSLAVNPQFKDYLGEPDQTDQWRGGGRDNTPPVPPVQSRSSSMPSTPSAPGLSVPTTSPAQSPSVAAPPRPPMGPPVLAGRTEEIPPPPEDQTAEDLENMQAVPPEPSSTAQPKTTRQKLEEATAEADKYRQPTEMKSNWAQRLGMALLASTKLAPVANMIVHPKWSAEESSRQRNLQAAEGKLTDLEKAENIGSLSEQRQYYGEARKDMAKTAADKVAEQEQAAAAAIDEKEAARHQKAFDVLSKDRAVVYRDQGEAPPDGWEKIPLQNPSIPENMVAYAPSGVATVPKELLEFLPGYKEGQQIDRPTLEAAGKSYRTKIEKLAEIEAKPEGNKPVDQQYVNEYIKLHPGATVADAVKQYHKDEQAPERPQQPPQALMIGPDGRAIAVHPGTVIPQGAQTPQGVNATNTPTAATRGMAEKAPRVIHFIDRINQLLDENEKNIGPLAGRWSEFTAGKVGLPNKGYTQIRTNSGLLETALMNMHVGSRGGERIMEHFHDLIGSAHQSPQNLRDALAEIRTYAEQVAQEGGKQAGAGGSIGKSYTQADVDRAVSTHPGLTPQQAESAFTAKGWIKK